MYSQSYPVCDVVVGSSPPGLIVRSTPNSRTVCIWFGLRPHSLDSQCSLAYMRPLASWSILSSFDWCIRFGHNSITNPYRIPCSLCERAWCIWFGPPATYHRLPASTCKEGWILVRSGRRLPGVTIHYHASLLSLHRFLTFTSHHLRGDTDGHNTLDEYD